MPTGERGSAEEHSSNRPTFPWSAGTSWRFVPLALGTPSDTALLLDVAKGESGASEARRLAQYVNSGVTSTSRIGEAAVKAIMKEVQTEAKPFSTCLSPRTSRNREIFGTQVRTSRLRFAAATPSPDTRRSSRSVLA